MIMHRINAALLDLSVSRLALRAVVKFSAEGQIVYFNIRVWIFEAHSDRLVRAVAKDTFKTVATDAI